MRKLFLISFLLAACSGPTVNEGVLIDKQDVPAHTEDKVNYGVCLFKDAKNPAICYQYLHYPEYVPEKCFYTLSNTKKETQTHEVNCDEYNNFGIGDYVTFKTD